MAIAESFEGTAGADGLISLDHLVSPLRRLERSVSGSDAEAARRAFDIVGVFDPRALAVAVDVMKALQEETVL